MMKSDKMADAFVATRLRQQSIYALMISAELIAVVTVSYVFLMEIAFSQKILIFLLITLFMYVTDSVQEREKRQLQTKFDYIEYTLTTDIFRCTLITHKLLEDGFSQMQAGQQVELDWLKANNHVVEGIDEHQQRAKALAVGRQSNEPGFFITFLMFPVMSVARLAAGYGLAWVAKTYASNLLSAVF